MANRLLHPKEVFPGLIPVSLRTASNWRRDDIARIRRGEAIRGPKWVVVNRSIAYREEDIRAFIDGAPSCAISGFDRSEPVEVAGG